MAEEKNIHAGHRQRLKKQFIAQGAEGMSDFTFLEMMLFFPIPNGDTNPLSHRLIEHLGSFDRVFDANSEELMAVKGVGEHSAAYLKQFSEWMVRYTAARASTDFTYKDYEAVSEFLDTKFRGLDHEKTMLLHYNASEKFVNSMWIGDGDLENVHLNTRQVAASINENKTKYVAFVHNHLSGSPQPSQSDLDALYALTQFLKMLDVLTIDNIIYTEKKTLFFSKDKKYNRLVVEYNFR